MTQDEVRSEKIYGWDKNSLLKPLTGDVLEIGPGYGTNLLHYSRDIRWLGLEPNISQHGYIHQKLNQLPFRDALIVAGNAEELIFDDNSFDAVVSTLVLCSVQDVCRSIKEAYRVLKKGGRFVFLEHQPKATHKRPHWLSPFHCFQAYLKKPAERLTTFDLPQTLLDFNFQKVNYSSLKACSPSTQHIKGVAIK
nr:class I SAM-dependent methyltransferase [Pleionea sp. CnH1-48]